MIPAHDTAWLLRCHAIATHLSAVDSEEWALDTTRGHVWMRSESGLELRIVGGRRIGVMGFYGDMEACAPTRPTAHNSYGLTMRFAITEDARKDDATIARAILRRCLHHYRPACAETTARYTIQVRRQQWEHATRQALAAATGNASQGYETVYLAGHRTGVTGKAQVSAYYGVQLDLHGLSRDQALHILAYIEETHAQRHTPTAD